jgi:hypothetical protein
MTTFIQHIYNRTTCNCSAFWQLVTTAKLLYLLEHSKFLCGSVSKARKMWRGQNPLGGQRHIQHSTQNLLPRLQRSRSPKDHHCLPETLLTKMLFSKSSVSLIRIYIYSQLQTNMWDAFQCCDCITQIYVVFTWISSWSNVNKCGCIASRDMNSTILLLYCEFVIEIMRFGPVGTEFQLCCFVFVC